MQTLTPALLAHLRGNIATLATCWLIEKADGTYIRGTDHDEDITIDPSGTTGDAIPGVYLAGTNYTASALRSTPDTAVDNMEINGAIPEATTLTDVTVHDIEAGLLDDAPVVLFVVNWQAPNDGQYIAKRGYLGDISRDSDSRYTCEFRSVKQLLAQQFMRSYSERCQVAEFGDAECGYDLDAATVAGTVTTVTSGKRFDATLATSSPAPASDWFDGGMVTFTTGQNAGFRREVKRGGTGGTLGAIQLWERLPYDPTPGDTFEISPGCDKTPTACKARGRFTTGWRGYGLWVQGIDALMRGPKNG